MPPGLEPNDGWLSTVARFTLNSRPWIQIKFTILAQKIHIPVNQDVGSIIKNRKYQWINLTFNMKQKLKIMFSQLTISGSEEA